MFEKTFGASSDQAVQLLESKILTIHRLHSLAPPGTLDPTPHLYASTMYTLGGIMGVAALAHYLVQPLSITQLAKYSPKSLPSNVITIPLVDKKE